MTEEAAASILAIYEKLLPGHTVPEQQEANRRICEMTGLEVVPVLFAICKQVQAEEYQFYSALHIKMCLNAKGMANIPLEQANTFRRMGLELLKTGKIGVGKIQLLAVLMQNADNLVWAELMKFLGELCQSDLFSVVSILEAVINTMRADCVVNNMALMVNAIDAALKCSDFNTTRQAVALLGRLSDGGMKLGDDVKARLRDSLKNLFFFVLREQKVDLLEKIASDYLKFYATENRDLLPFQDIVRPIVEVLTRDGLQWDFRFLLYVFYELSFRYDVDMELSLDDVNMLICFERDFFMATIARNVKDEIENLSFTTTIVMLLKRIDRGVRREYAFKFMEHLRGLQTMPANCCILEFVSEALRASPESFENDLGEIFAMFTQALAQKGTLLQYTAINAMDPILGMFADKIEENLERFFQLLISYIDVDVEMALEFMRNTLVKVNNADPIFQGLNALLSHVLSTNDQRSILWCRAMLTLAVLIKQSDRMARELFDDIIKPLFGVLGRMAALESPQSVVFECLSSLTDVCPEKMAAYLPEVVPKVLKDIVATDCPYGQFDALNWLQTLIDREILPGNLYEPVWALCQSMVEQPWLEILTRDEDAKKSFLAACQALEILGLIVSVTRNTQLVDVVMKSVMLFLGTVNIVEDGFTSALTTLGNIIEDVKTDDRLKLLVNHFFSLLANSDLQREASILDMLRKMIECCGIDLLYSYNPNSDTTLLEHVAVRIKWVVEKDLFDQELAFASYMKEAMKLAVILGSSGRNVQMAQVIEMFSQYANNDSWFMRKSVLRLYRDAVAADQSCIRLPVIQEFLTNFEQHLAEPEVVAVLVCKLVSTVCKCQTIDPEMKAISCRIMEILQKAVARDIASHRTKLTEYMAAAMAVIAGHQIGENFDYDPCVKLILACLPLKYIGPNLYDDIMVFLPTIIRSVSPECQQQILRHCIILVAEEDPNQQNATADTMANAVKDYFPFSNPENVATVLGILGGDQEKLAVVQQRIQRLPLSNPLPL